MTDWHTCSRHRWEARTEPESWCRTHKKCPIDLHPKRWTWNSTAMERNLLACLESWCEELRSRSSRVRHLIGDKHWLSDGHQKEYILREFLNRHLGKHFEISRGFVCPPDAENPISGEVDILIFDSCCQPVWFFEGGLALVPPSSVVAQLHVKTRLQRPEFTDVVLSVVKANRAVAAYSSSRLPWAGGFFFIDEPARSPEVLRKFLCASLARCYKESELSGSHFVRWLPDCIATLEGPAVFFSKEESLIEQGIVRLRAFGKNKLGPAIILADMFDHLPRGERTTRSALTNLIARSPSDLIIDFELRLKSSAYTKTTQKK
jgi:hypothetical protein